ncbi:ankyrin repeat domain-containing protein 16-like [Branchiostoma floridae x Branchiostoma japonicum]
MASVNSVSDGKSYAASEVLLAAAQIGSIQGVKAALKDGADIDFEMDEGERLVTGTALLNAVTRGDLDMIRLLLRKGASVHKRVKGEDEFTLLHLAAHQGKTEVVELLVYHGATLDVLDGLDNTPLMAAAGNNHVDTVRRLIELGARPDLTDGYIAVRLGIDDIKRQDFTCRESIRLIQEARRTKLLRCCNTKCGKPGYRKTLKLCAGCKLTRYCSRECQKQHWSVGHKKCCGHDERPAVEPEFTPLPMTPKQHRDNFLYLFGKPKKN